jgi:putative proteasome-type protease
MVKDGLIALADGRITAGTQVTSATKAVILGDPENEIVIMSSGLRSLRDKTLTYMRHSMQRRGVPYSSIYEAVTDYSAQFREVARSRGREVATSRRKNEQYLKTQSFHSTCTR